MTTRESVEGAEAEIPAVDLPGWWLRIDKAVVTLTKVAVVLIGVTFTVLISFEVLSRFLLHASVPQTNATARFLLVWFFMIGAGLALRQGGHVGLDLIARNLRPPLSGIVYALAQMMTLTFLVLMIRSAFVAFLASRVQVEGSLGVSLGWVMAAFPIGFGLLIYHQAVMVTDALRLAIRRPAAR